jgi:pyruvate dehydrogenase E2 component (dihydrolipoamide acetyltransferase)
MSQDIRMPEVSEGVTKGKVISVVIAVGDRVQADQTILELETDKAVVALPSPFTGKITEILVKEGDTVEVGQAFMRGDPELQTTGPAPAPAPRPEAKKGVDPAVTPELEKHEPALSAPAAPAAARASAPASAPRADLPPPRTESTPPDQVPPASPLVRRAARELGVDIHAVPGSGPGGRITEDDVRAFVRGAMERIGSGNAATTSARPLPDFTRWGEVERQPVSQVRRLTGEAMLGAWLSAPQVTQYDQADITGVESFRQQFNESADKAGKLTMTTILAKVVAHALRVFPQFNSSLDVAKQELILKKYVHVGVAVDTPRGLLVPVLRDVDRKGLAELATELNATAGKTRDGKIAPADLEGGTFTISNLGGIGGVAFSPIVYTPQVAILGVSQSSLQPVWDGQEFQPRLILPLSLSYDHRVVDGADGARFLRWICRALEQPLLLQVEGGAR